MKIGAKLKASLACDNEGNLYSWGSASSGLLGYKATKNVNVPVKIPLVHEGTYLKVNKLSVGHFHVAAIVDKKYISKIPENYDEIIDEKNKSYDLLFKSLISWFEKSFIPQLRNNSDNFLFLICKLHTIDPDVKCEYSDLENYFLSSFYSHLENSGKSVFKVKSFYKKIIKQELEISFNEDSISVRKFIAILSANKSQNSYIKEINLFLKSNVNHFLRHTDDIIHFIRFVFQFKSFASMENLRKLFGYIMFESLEKPQKLLDFHIENKISTLFNELKMSKSIIKERYEKLENTDIMDSFTDDYLIEVNVFLDYLMNTNLGVNIVFTWGYNTEDRLGYEVYGYSNTNKKENDSNNQSSLSTINSLTQDTKKNEKNSNDNSNIEDDTIIYYPKPILFPSAKVKIIDICCSYSHTLALSSIREVYSWGSSKYGCLGIKSDDNSSVPRLIKYDINGNQFKDIEKIACGMYFSLALSTKGKVYSWGYGNLGRLGHNNENSYEMPNIITFFEDNDIFINNIKCGDTFSAAICNAKQIYTWGNGSNGMLGHGNYLNLLAPKKIYFFSDSKIENVFLGSYNSIAMLSDNQLFTWGKNCHGMLGMPNYYNQTILIPTEIVFQDDIVVREISLGTMHTLFITSTGKIYSCGNSLEGCLGIPNIKDKLKLPKQIEDHVFYKTLIDDIRETSIFNKYNSEGSLKSSSDGIIYVALSNLNSAFITNKGELFMCGEESLIITDMKQSKDISITNQEEKKGLYLSKNNNKTESITYSHFENSNWNEGIYEINPKYLSEKVTFIALSKTHAICIAKNRAYSWGTNNYGKLGLFNVPLNEVVSKPTLINKIENLKMAAVSETHSLILTHNGSIYAFGSNMYGKLGIGSLNKYYQNDKLIEPNELEPVRCRNITFADYIACGPNHSACIMKYDKNMENSYKIFTWGSSFSGKLGNLNPDDICEPTEVEQLDLESIYFIQVELGNEFSVALDIKGKLWAWGRKKYIGFYNDNDLKNDIVKTPIRLNSESTYTYISASEVGVMAIDIDGNTVIFGGSFDKGNITYSKFSECKSINNEEKMELGKMGLTHSICIDGTYNCPYSWGNNLYFKCGQKFYSDISGIETEVNFSNTPKRIDYILEKVLGNKELEKQKNKVTVKKNAISRHYIQNILFNKIKDMKDDNVILEDIKLNRLFYSRLKEAAIILRESEKTKQNLFLKNENLILDMIFTSKAKKVNEFKSEVPRIINYNIQIFEAFLGLLYVHPCYFSYFAKKIKNPQIFIDLVKIIFGKNMQLINESTKLNVLVGIWNSVFNVEKGRIETESVSYKNYISYEMYIFLFECEASNKNVIFDIISEILAITISELLSNPKSEVIDISDGESTNILKDYLEIDQNTKSRINISYINCICEKISQCFMNCQFQNSKNNFKIRIFLIFQQLLHIFNHKKYKVRSEDLLQTKDDNNKDTTSFGNTNTDNSDKKEKNKTDEEYLFEFIQNKSSKLSKEKVDQILKNNILYSFNKILNFFLFTPFINVLKSYNEAENNEVSSILFDKFISTIFNNPKYKLLKNSYNSDPIKFQNNVIRKILTSKNEIITQINNIFIDLANGNMVDNNKQLKYFEDLSLKQKLDSMNYICISSLEKLDYDFSLYSLKESIKYNIENLNKVEVIPINIRDLIELKTSFVELLNSNDLSDEDPIKDILMLIKEFKIEDLDSISSVKNYVINFYIKPNMYFYLESSDICLIKCKNCLQAVPKEFLPEKTQDLILYNTSWTCSCNKENQFNGNIGIKCNSCKKYRNFDSISEYSFFKKFSVENEEEYLQTYEDVLYLLPELTQDSDIENEVIVKLKHLSSNSDIDKINSDILRKFLNDVSNNINTTKESSSYSLEKFKLFKQWDQKLEVNLIKRITHLSYLEGIREFIDNLVQNVDSARLMVKKQQEDLSKIGIHLKNGFSNLLAEKYVPVNLNENKSIIKSVKKFQVIELMEKNVVNEILFDDNKQQKLESNSFITFEKNENGVEISLRFNEVNRTFIVCGINKQEYLIEKHFLTNEIIYELKNICRTNSSYNLGGIRFNTFYLVKLLNTL